MSAPVVTVTIEPDGVRPDEYVVAIAVDGVERERATWRSLDQALGRLWVSLRRFLPQVYA